MLKPGSMLRFVLVLTLLSIASACTTVRRPAFGLRPREVGTFTGTIAVGENAPSNVTSCIAHRSISREGETFAADFVARGDYRVTIAAESDASILTTGQGSSARTMVLSRSECARHDVHFFVREGVLHGSASLDCATVEGRVKVSASFDNCGAATTPHEIVIRKTPLTYEHIIR